MRQFLAVVAPAFLVGGCSWIYNPSNIKPMIDAHVDAKEIDAFTQIDARVDAAPIRDADPTMLTIDQVVPGVINEGAGDGHSRNALIVVHGHHMTQMATAQITGATNVSVVSQQVSVDGDWMAVLVHAAVDTTPATDSGTTPLTVAVDEPGSSGPQMLTGMLVLQNLPQLVTTNGQSLDVTTLAQLYSQVSGTGTVTFTGDSDHQAIVRAVANISLATVVATGVAANKDAAGGGGPGGCGGGAVGVTGGCAGFNGAGGGGAALAGGGGGGNTAGAAAGNGAGGGMAGAAGGNPQVVNYVTDATGTNRAGGGGGGGGGSGGVVGLKGGAGGGGGGIVELDAGGDITVTSLDVSGGNGGNATPGALGGDAGGGGGGAGGIVVVRSQHGTVAVGAKALGGTPGTPANSGGGGGAGSFGKIRIDAPGGTLPTTMPAAHRGPMYATATAQIVTTVNPMMMVLGANGDMVSGYDVDPSGMDHNGEPIDQMFTNGMLNLVPAMLPGYNKLCLTLTPGMRHDDLADTCIELAYLP